MSACSCNQHPHTEWCAAVPAKDTVVIVTRADGTEERHLCESEPRPEGGVILKFPPELALSTGDTFEFSRLG
jgi:hypothetical protein